MILLEVMEHVGIDLVVVLIFYSFMMFLLVLAYIKCLWDLLKLLSDYHNNEHHIVRPLHPVD